MSPGREPLPSNKLLHSLMAVRTKDLLWRSVHEHNVMSRPLELLLCPARVWRRGWLAWSIMPSNLHHIRLSTTVSRQSRLLSRHRLVSPPQMSTGCRGGFGLQVFRSTAVLCAPAAEGFQVVPELHLPFLPHTRHNSCVIKISLHVAALWVV